MMNNVKCECGHVNPHGTYICEACGKIMDESRQKNKLIDMRYEGRARRSQTYNRTIIDKIWNFFSSVKVGVILIIITLIASGIGTILPQEQNLGQLPVPTEQYYKEEYGWFGQVYYFLGFHDIYRSWWYILLVASIGVSLVICSLDRFVPLYKALKNQRVVRNPIFLSRQRLYGEQKMDEKMEQRIPIIKERLRKKRYQIREENGNILAEKGRFSRWGPYVNHIGLIIFLIGCMFRYVPGFYMNEQLWIKEGETLAIPGTDKKYYLTNHQFLIEVYDESDGEVYQKALEQKGTIVKNFQSNVTLYEAEETLPGEKPELEKLGDYKIQVNHPLKFDRYAIYQSSYRLNELAKMSFQLTKKDSNESFGEITIDLSNPQKKYELGKGYIVEVLSYFPDFKMENGEPTTESSNPVNPAFAFKMITPDKPDGEVSFTAIQQTIEPFGENEYKMAFQSVETVNYSGLTVRKDLTLPIIAMGGIIFLIGVSQGSFWQHRRIWLKFDNDKFQIAGHTNKNWFGFKKEIDGIIEGTGIPKPIDQHVDKNDIGLASDEGVDTNGGA